MIVIDIIGITSAMLIVGIVLLTAKFSREMPVNKNFNELWFENTNAVEQQSGTDITTSSHREISEKQTLAKAA